MTRQPTLRASDADREQVAERLRHAAAEGRLLAEEFEERLGVALSARTYGELDALVADLPSTSVSYRRRSNKPAGVPIGLTVAALMVLISAISLGDHPRPYHHWSGGGGSAGAIWVVWIAIALGFFALRRARARRSQ